MANCSTPPRLGDPPAGSATQRFGSNWRTFGSPTSALFSGEGGPVSVSARASVGKPSERRSITPATRSGPHADWTGDLLLASAAGRIVIVLLHGSELVSEDVRDPVGNLFAHPSANFNGIPKLHATEHAGVDDFRSEIVRRLEHVRRPGHRAIEYEMNHVRAVEMFDNPGRRARPTSVCCGIFRVRRGNGQPDPSSIRCRGRIPVGVPGPDGRHGSPEVVVELGVPARYLRVEDRGVGHPKEASGLANIETVLNRVPPECAAVLGDCMLSVETSTFGLLGRPKRSRRHSD